MSGSDAQEIEHEEMRRAVAAAHGLLTSSMQDVLKASRASGEHGASLGATARAYVEREHALPAVADAYVEALEVAAGGAAVEDALLPRVAQAAAEVGIGDVTELARALRESGIAT